MRASFPSGEMQRLQEQNASLRRAVAEMRKEMETLSDHVPPPAPSGARAADTEQPRPSPEAAAEAPGEQGPGQQEEGREGTRVSTGSKMGFPRSLTNGHPL